MEQHTSEQDHTKITLGTIISWALGVLFTASGVIGIFSDPIMGIFVIVAGLILLPPVNAYIQEKYKFSLSGGVKFIVVVLLVIIAGSIKAADDHATGTVVSDNGSPTTTQSAPQKKNLEIADISTKVTEKNSVWWRFSWNLTLKNNTDRTRTTAADIKWVDSEGFVIDSAHEYSLEIPANSEKTFNGFALIQVPGASNVESVQAELSGF